MRLALRSVLADLDGISKPADLQRALKLDQTLSWQLFKISGASDVLSGGSVVPSRTSLERFLKAAKARGVSAAKVQQVLAAHTAFEDLITLHAGDRVTFNSMVSASSGLDEEWLATDLQHRRNMFRALSHSMGMRTKTRVQLVIVNDSPEELLANYAVITGAVDTRVLRDFPSLRVYGMEILGNQHKQMTRRPLGTGPEANGYLLSEFSSPVSGAIQLNESRSENSVFFEASLKTPVVGNVGSSTLMFGEAMLNYPFEEGEERGFGAIAARPYEVLINDMLIMPGSYKGLTPRPAVYWRSFNDADGANPATQMVEGNFAVERLGTGPDALATPDVPNYPAMARGAVRSLGWDLERAEAWRIRVEYPMYQTNIRMSWNPPDPE